MRSLSRLSPSLAGIMLALALCLSFTSPVRADEGAPPPESAPPISAAPDEPRDAASSDPAAAPTTPAEAPASPDLPAMDEGQVSVPVAAESALEPAIASDPMWCPAGAAPVAPAIFVEGGCSPVGSNNNFTALTTWLTLNPRSVPGVIWILGSYDSTGVGDLGINWNGPGLPSMRPFALTLKGGWTGIGTAIDPTNPSEFDHSVNIYNWIGALTLSDILVHNAPFNNAGISVGGMQPALHLHSVGSITLTRVDSSDNDVPANNMLGAWLVQGSAGTVTITDAKFDSNDRGGLLIWSNGTVTLKNVAAIGNHLNAGVAIDNTAVASPKPVSITNGLFTLNFQNGLDVWSHGAITLTNTIATENGLRGANLDNCREAAGVCAGTGTVRVLGVNNFSDNGDAGLQVYSNGAITVNQAVADQNDAAGLFLDNSTAAVPQNITLTGSFTALGNSREGLVAFSKGAFAAANMTASDNGDVGAYITNDGGVLSKSVTLTGLNVFNDNGKEGLWIISRGAVTLSSLRAIHNGFIGLDPHGTGVVVDNTVLPNIQQGVTLTGVNVFADNYYTGLEIESYGAVTLSNITATHNGEGASPWFGDGVYVANQGGMTAKPVVVSGTNSFTRNDYAGLWIESDGAVTLNNLTARENGGYGICAWNTNSLGVAAGISVNGQSDLSFNGMDGLYMISDGAITLNKITASFNSGDGVRLENDDPPAGTYPGVSLRGYLTSTGSFSRGLTVYSDGPISAAYLTLTDNGDEGALLHNDGGAIPKSVTLTGVNVFQNNDDEGLVISTNGAVSLSSIIALGNGRSADFLPGVWIQNCGWNGAACTTPTRQQNVTLSGTNVISDNGYHGLQILSYGTVTISNLTANNNGKVPENSLGNGAYIQNDGGLAARAVTLTGTNNFIDNDENGLDITSDGAITVSNLTASYNGWDGADMYNNTATNLLQSKVTITGYGIFEWNTYDGLWIYTNGAVLGSNLTANQNGDDGVNIYTIGISGPQPVTLSGSNNFFSNGSIASEAGLYVAADGNITVSNITAGENSGFGAALDNRSNWELPIVNFPTFGSVTISGFGHFDNNMAGDGLFVRTHGSVTLARISADSNGDGAGDAGIRIYADGNVTLVCSSAMGNVGTGLYVRNGTGGNGALTLTLKGFYARVNGANEWFMILAPAPVRTYCP